MDRDEQRDDTAHEEAGASSTSPATSEADVPRDIGDIPVSATSDGPQDLTAGAVVREEELDQVHQKIPDTHQF